MEAGTRYHVSLYIAGALKRADRSLDGVLAEDGREFTGQEVKAFLVEQRRKHGYTHYSGCDNMNAEGRCGGHPIG